MTVYFDQAEIPRPAHIGGGSWRLRQLSDLTIIFGRNGSGKSQLLRQLRDQRRMNSHYASPERGGEISFNPSYMQEELLPGTRGSRRQGNAALTYRDEGVARIQAFLARRGNIRGEELPLSPDRLERLMNLLMPAFEFEITAERNVPFRLVRAGTGEEISNSASLSSGEVAMFALGLDLTTICGLWSIEKLETKLMLLDEPDLHLHPDLQQHLASFVIEVIEEFEVQVMVATHSTTLLAAFGHYGGERTSVIYLDRTIETQRTVRFDRSLQEIATCLGGHALMGPLFALPLLLVEGDDDYKVWSQAVRHQVLKVAVIPCEGDRINDYVVSLERIFEATLDPPPRHVAYALRDRDERIEQPHDTEQRFVHRIWLSCRETENLYLSDEVLTALGITWPEAIELIRAHSGDFGQKADHLRRVAETTDRGTEDIKGVMEELQQILDPTKKVDWRIRVGQVIGAGPPVGQLASFLGEPVLRALWRPGS